MDPSSSLGQDTALLLSGSTSCSNPHDQHIRRSTKSSKFTDTKLNLFLKIRDFGFAMNMKPSPINRYASSSLPVASNVS